MRILAIGDPHGDLEKIKKISLKDIDLILVTGDLGSSSLMRKMAFDNIERRKKGLPELEYSARQRKMAFMEAYNSSMKLVKYLSRHASVYVIYGNVESSNAETKEESKEIGLKLPLLTDDLERIKGVRVLNNKRANFDGARIGGLKYFLDISWVKEFKPEGYQKRLQKAKERTAKAKKVLRRFGRLNILLCHQPPYGILDKVTAKFVPKYYQGKHAGSKTILDYIKKYHPKYVFCGHIHEGEGHAKVGKTEVYNLGVAGWKIVEL